MNFLSGRKVYDLFDNSSFVDAIRKKDICDVKNIIRKTCGFHLDGMLNTPVCKMLSVEAPDRFEIMKQQKTDEFEKEVNLLAEIIFESGMGILPECEIDPTLLISAIRQNQIDVVKFYFWLGGSPNLKAKVDYKKQCGGESLIHYAADLEGNDIMMFMIQNGANVNAKTLYGLETPIHRATAAGNQNIIRMLWGCGADIDAVNSDGETALMLATKNSDPEMVYLLARLSADVNLVNSEDQTASDLAKIHSVEIIIEMLTERETGIEFPMIEGFVSFGSDH